MKLSVILPAFNAADTIGIQLEALARQSWDGPWEVIVADNGSTDETRSIVEQYQDRLPNFRIVDASDRRGAAHARNVGVRHAAGDALLFCDADDEVAPGWLAAMGTALTKHDFVASRLEAEKLSKPWALTARGCPQQNGLQEYKYPPYLSHAASAGLGVKRWIHEVVDGFDEALYKLMDTDYCWRIQLAGTELHFVPDALVHMRFRDTPAGLYRQARQWGEYNVKLYKRYRQLGMPKVSWTKPVGRWFFILSRFPHVWSPHKRGRWLKDFNWSLGRLIGCIKYRVLAP